MAAFTFNVAKGKSARYAELPGVSDGIIAILLVDAGLETDAVLKDYDTVAALLAGASNEATFSGYVRQPLVGVSVVTDDAGDTVNVDFEDVTFLPTSAQALGKIIFAYDPDTAAGTDADLLPLWADDFALTTLSSGSVSYVVHADGLFGAS